VLGNLEFALDHLPPSDDHAGVGGEVGQALTQAREGAERIRQTTRDLRVFCRTDHDERRAVNVVKVMESSIRMAWNELRHRARLVRRFGSVPSIVGNEARLGQVFLNLLVNAAHAIPEGDTEGNEIVVSIRAIGDLVVVEVSDTGSGIAPQHLSRIFEPFFTTKPEGIGSGIGLSICQSIVADLGGELEVQSKLGVGSRFSVRLPAQVAIVSALPPPTPIVALRRARVMAIDDEPSLCAVLKRLLKRDHDVVSFTDAREALDALKTDGGFDLIFCDLMMPSMSGIDFHRALLDLDPDLASRTVFVTGGAFNGHTRKFLETVPNRVLEKPFDGPTLFGIVNQVLDSFPRSGTWLTRELGQAL
jgi:CheY-like chemotaxis protein